MSEAEHVEWCKTMFAMLDDGGMWGIPRSGLIFRKRGAELVLTSSMPYDPAMPITEAQFIEQQAHEFDSVQRHFAAAGISVTKEEA